MCITDSNGVAEKYGSQSKTSTLLLVSANCGAVEEGIVRCRVYTCVAQESRFHKTLHPHLWEIENTIQEVQYCEYLY